MQPFYSEQQSLLFLLNFLSSLATKSAAIQDNPLPLTRFYRAEVTVQNKGAAGSSVLSI